MADLYELLSELNVARNVVDRTAHNGPGCEFFDARDSASALWAQVREKLDSLPATELKQKESQVTRILLNRGIQVR